MRVIEPPTALLEQLKNRYGEAHRAYHDWRHVDALLALYETHKGLMRDPTRVLWAIYWHDAIYDPAASDNEARSAALLRAQAEPFLPDARIVQIEKLILATANHDLPDGLGFDVTADCAAFLDFDLAIFAAPEAAFDAYEQGIRKEYAFAPDSDFAAARKTALERFLLRERLYYSPMLARAWDGKARANLRRAIGKLTPAIVAG
jgi:predicted metal-dependent HD superfamily phosphohydrolase